MSEANKLCVTKYYTESHGECTENHRVFKTASFVEMQLNDKAGGAEHRNIYFPGKK